MTAALTSVPISTGISSLNALRERYCVEEREEGTVCVWGGGGRIG